MSTPLMTVSTADAAKQLGVAPSTLSRWVRQNKIAPVSQGTGLRGERFFNQADIQRLREISSVRAA